MRIELPFNGTPFDFAGAFHEFAGDYRNSAEWTPFILALCEQENGIKPDVPYVAAQITGTDSDFGRLYGVPVPRMMTVTARRSPDGKAMLFIDCDDDRDWPELQKAWELLQDYLAKRGRLAAQPTPSAAPDLTLPTSGAGAKSKRKRSDCGTSRPATIAGCKNALQKLVENPHINFEAACRETLGADVRSARLCAGKALKEFDKPTQGKIIKRLIDLGEDKKIKDWREGTQI